MRLVKSTVLIISMRDSKMIFCIQQCVRTDCTSLIWISGLLSPWFVLLLALVNLAWLRAVSIFYMYRVCQAFLALITSQVGQWNILFFEDFVVSCAWNRWLARCIEKFHACQLCWHLMEGRAWECMLLALVMHTDGSALCQLLILCGRLHGQGYVFLSCPPDFQYSRQF